MAINEILPFSGTDTGTNLLTQAEYEADTQRPIGNQPGIARSKLVNKAMKQSSLIAAAVAEYIAENQDDDVIDTLTPTVIKSMLSAAFAGNFMNKSFLQSGTGAYPRDAQEKVRETCVSVVDYMTPADRTNNFLAPGNPDLTYAFNAAVTFLAGGGKLLVPKTKYKLSDEIVLPSGITIEGEGAGDNVYGSPPAFASIPTYLFQATPGKSIFFIGGGLTDITIKKMAMGASQVITAEMAPTTDGRYGIRCEGSFPMHSLMFRFEDLLFYNLERGLSIVDPYAQTNPPPHTYDWNCCPIVMTNCRFLYPKIGIYVDTNNIDFSTFINCAFSIPSGGAGVHLKVTGYLRFIQCAGGGASASSNAFFVLDGAGVSSMDNITLEGCQAESLTHFIRCTPGATNLYRYMLTCRDCIAEMGADIYLHGNVHFISEASRWTIGIYTDSADVRISSKDDHFSGGGGFWFLSGIDGRDIFMNFKAGPNPPPGFADIVYDNGYRTIRGVSAPVAGKSRVGDRVINMATTAGAPEGWACITAGTPGTWQPHGQIGFRSQAGSPVNTVTPIFPGEEFFDTANLKWYKARDTDGSHWQALN